MLNQLLTSLKYNPYFVCLYTTISLFYVCTDHRGYICNIKDYIC